MDSRARDAAGSRTSPARAGWTGRLIGRADSGRVARLESCARAAALLPVLTAILAASLAGQAQAQTEEWSASITTGSLSTLIGVWPDRSPAIGSMTDRDFDYDGTTYTFSHIRVSSGGGLQINMTAAFSQTALDNLTFQTGSSSFALSDATTSDNRAMNWNSAGLSWSSGQTIAVKMVSGTTTLSTDATLSGLALADNSGTAITLSPSTFVSTTKAYTAAVANSIDEITITPTVNESNATYEIQNASGTALTDADTNTTGFQVDLTVGATTIKVEVTAEDTTTDTYQVTVTRATATPPPTHCETGDIWCANMTVAELTALGLTIGHGYNSTLNQGTLAPDEFEYDGTDYMVSGLIVTPGFDTPLRIGFDPSGEMVFNTDNFFLYVDGTAFLFDDATFVSGDQFQWVSARLNWSTGDTVELRLVERSGTAATGKPTISGTARVGQTLTADTSGIADADGLATVSYSYQWIRVQNLVGTEISGATASTYTPVADDVGKTIMVKVTFSDDAGNPENSTSDAYPSGGTVEDIATGNATGQPVITGAAQVGKTLTAEIGTIADTDGLPGTFPDDYTLQWRRVDADGVSNEVDISGETSGTYTPVAADVGKKIKVQVSFTDDGSNAEGPLTSAAYPSNAPVAAAAGACPADNDWCTTLTVGFSEDGIFKYYGFSTAITDDGLADTTIDDGDGTTWTVSTMVIADAIINDQVHINLDAFLARGSVFDLGGTTFTTDETSESTVTTGNYSWLLPAGFAWVHGQDVTVSVKLPANAPATGVPEISGSPQVGKTLSAGTTGIMDLDGLTSVSYTYQWIRVDVDGTSNPVDVGTDDDEYTLVAADEGKRIKVQVTFTDDDSNAEELTSDAYLTPSHHSYPDRGIMPALSACPASTTWCATMNVGFQLPGTDNTEFGFSASPGYGALDDTSFDYDGSTFTVENVGIRNPDGMSGYHVRLDLDAFVPRGAVFDLNGYTFTADAAAEQTSTGRYRWALPAGFRIAEGVDYRVSLQLTDNTPAEGKPTISGPAQVGRTLTAATADITDDEGLTSVSYTYQWIAAGTVIAGATSVTYTPTSSEQGDKITVRVTFDDDEDNPETLISDETIPVAPAAATCPTDAATVWCDHADRGARPG